MTKSSAGLLCDLKVLWSLSTRFNWGPEHQTPRPDPGPHMVLGKFQSGFDGFLTMTTAVHFRSLIVGGPQTRITCPEVYIRAASCLFKLLLHRLTFNSPAQPLSRMWADPFKSKQQDQGVQLDWRTSKQKTFTVLINCCSVGEAQLSGPHLFTWRGGAINGVSRENR